jgi:hypothetical protein
MKNLQCLMGRKRTSFRGAAGTAVVLLEALEQRLLLSAAYEVWAGNVDLGETAYDRFYSIDKQPGYVKLGEANGTAVFNGNYRFYVVAAHGPVLIDTFQGSDGSYDIAEEADGNVTNFDNSWGPPDGKYAFFDGTAGSGGTFGAFMVLYNRDSNPWSSIRVITSSVSPVPDLTVKIEGVQPQAQVHRGDVIIVSCRATNDGFAEIEDGQAFHFSFYLSTDYKLDQADRQLAPVSPAEVVNNNNAGMEPHATYSMSAHLTIPQDMQYGDYYLITKVDSQNEVNEGASGGENNNTDVTQSAVIHVVGGTNQPVNYAVLFSGGGDATNNRIQFYDDTKKIYQMLVSKYGLVKQNIYVLYADGTDPGVDRADGKDSDMSFASGSHVLSATKDNLKSTLSTLADIKSSDYFFFLATDHGSGLKNVPSRTNEEKLCGWGENIRDAELAPWLTSVKSAHSTFVFTECFSGGMVDDLMPLGVGSFACAAANHYESSWFVGNDFITEFTTALENGYNTTYDAYRYAYTNDQYATDGEGPEGTNIDYVEHPWCTGGDFRIFYTASNSAPSLTSVSTLAGGKKNHKMTITYATLAGAANATDPDGDKLRFIVDGITSGTLTKKDSAVVSGVTTIGYGEALVWLPPTDDIGIVNAFTIRASDGLATSATAAQVKVDVSDLNVAALFVTDNSGNAMNDGLVHENLKFSPAMSGYQGESLTFSLANIGNQPLNVNSFVKTGSGASDFLVTVKNNHGNVVDTSGGTFGIAPGATYTIEAIFAPQTIGERTANITFQTNDPSRSGPQTLTLNGVSISSTPPTLTKIDTLSGAVQDTAFPVTYSALRDASDASDVDPDRTIAFRVESVFSGTLTQDSEPVIPGQTLLSLGEELLWQPPAGRHGNVAAFTVRAYDGVLESSDDVQVNVTVNQPSAVIGTGVAKSLTYTDPDGTTVTVSLTGGNATLTFNGENITQTGSRGKIMVNGDNVTIDSIELADTIAKSNLSFTTRGGAVPGATVGSITGSTVLGTLSAKTMDLVGDGIDMTGSGYVGSIKLHDILYDADIIMPGTGASKGLSISCALVDGDTTINTGSPIKKLSVAQWDDGLLEAPWVAGISVKAGKNVSDAVGDFGADIVIDGDGAPSGKPTLGKVSIAGGLYGGSWDVTGSIGTVKIKGWVEDCQISSDADIASFAAGGISGSTLFAGVGTTRDDNGDGVFDLPIGLADFDAASTIKKFTIKGIKEEGAYVESFINSNIAARYLGNIKLCFAQLDNGGEPFGFAADFIKKISYKDADLTGSLSNLDVPGDMPAEIIPQLLDLEVRLF